MVRTSLNRIKIGLDEVNRAVKDGLKPSKNRSELGNDKSFEHRKKKRLDLQETTCHLGDTICRFVTDDVSF